MTVATIARRIVLILALGVFAQAAAAAPVDVQIWGRSFRVDPRVDREDMDARTLPALRTALPPDLAASPGFQPSDEQVLAEVEERTWIAQFQLEDAFKTLMAAQKRRNPRLDEFTLTMQFYAGDGSAISPEVQKLVDTHAALRLLRRGLRVTMGKPEEPSAGGHFTLPPIPAKVVATYRQLGFDPAAAYAGFRKVKAAYRSGDFALIGRVIDFPFTLYGARRRTFRNPAELAAARDIVLHPAVKEAVARQAFNDLFVRDQGAMFGNGEVWIGPSTTQFAVRAINPP